MFASGGVDQAVITTLGDWIDRTARISKLVIDARIAERQTAIDEAIARMVITAVDRVVRDRGRVVRAWMRAILP
jgi:hypothetical protein